MLFLQRSFYKTEISLLRVGLIWKRRISKIYNLHFLAIKRTVHNANHFLSDILGL